VCPEQPFFWCEISPKSQKINIHGEYSGKNSPNFEEIIFYENFSPHLD
jgi:hypothetical protein